MAFLNNVCVLQQFGVRIENLVNVEAHWKFSLKQNKIESNRNYKKNENWQMRKTKTQFRIMKFASVIFLYLPLFHSLGYFAIQHWLQHDYSHRFLFLCFFLRPPISPGLMIFVYYYCYSFICVKCLRREKFTDDKNKCTLRQHMLNYGYSIFLCIRRSLFSNQIDSVWLFAFFHCYCCCCPFRTFLFVWYCDEREKIYRRKT